MPMRYSNEPEADVAAGAQGFSRLAWVIADKSLYLAHLALTVFAGVGWMLPASRLLNWYVIVLIFASWFGLGLRFGFTYCLLTDLQSRVRRHLGSKQPMKSFVKDLLDRITKRDLNPAYVEIGTQLAFYLSAAASFYVNFGYHWL